MTQLCMASVGVVLTTGGLAQTPRPDAEGAKMDGSIVFVGKKT